MGCAASHQRGVGAADRTDPNGDVSTQQQSPLHKSSASQARRKSSAKKIDPLESAKPLPEILAHGGHSREPSKRTPAAVRKRNAYDEPRLNRVPSDWEDPFNKEAATYFDIEGNVSSTYEIGDLLGKGSFGAVYSGTHRRSGDIVAIKVMDRTKIKASSIHRELTVLKRTGQHENVVLFKGVYTNSTTVSFVMEVMGGGELFDRLIEQGAYSESQARDAMFEVAKGLAYLHGRNVIHRDLKPENLLLDTKSKEAKVKIADFGLSQIIQPGESLTKVCGTWAYAAPEMSDHSKPGYTANFDIWGFGVIMFIVLCGYHPFDPEGGLPVDEIKFRARNAVYDFDQPEWATISGEAKDLISNCIVKDPQKRFSSKEVLQHPWFAAHLKTTPISENINQALQVFRALMRKKLKGTMYASLAMASMRRLSAGSMYGGARRSSTKSMDINNAHLHATSTSDVGAARGPVHSAGAVVAGHRVVGGSMVLSTPPAHMPGDRKGFFGEEPSASGRAKGSAESSHYSMASNDVHAYSPQADDVRQLGQSGAGRRGRGASQGKGSPAIGPVRDSGAGSPLSLNGPAGSGMIDSENHVVVPSVTDFRRAPDGSIIVASHVTREDLKLSKHVPPGKLSPRRDVTDVEHDVRLGPGSDGNPGGPVVRRSVSGKVGCGAPGCGVGATSVTPVEPRRQVGLILPDNVSSASSSDDGGQQQHASHRTRLGSGPGEMSMHDLSSGIDVSRRPLETIQSFGESLAAIGGDHRSGHLATDSEGGV